MRISRKLVVLTSVVGAIFATMGATVSNAKADAGCTTASNGVTFCNVQATSDAEQSDVKTAKLSLTSNGVLELKLEMNRPPKHTHGMVCIWVTGGTNSFFNQQHQLVWISWAGKRAHICHTGRGPTGWQKVGPGPKCWNFFAPPHHRHPPVFMGPFKVVNKFDTTVKLSLKLTISATITATASCSVNGAAASATATGSDMESIVITEVATAKTFAQASGKAANLAVHSQAASTLKSTVTVTATYKMHASASATCQASPPQPPTIPPPSVSITSFTNLNLTVAGKNSGPAPFSVNASAPGSVTVSADLGGVSDCNSTTPQSVVTFQLVAGDNSECVIYYAPDDADKPPSDTITYTATVTTAGGTAKDVKTDQVDIQYPVRP